MSPTTQRSPTAEQLAASTWLGVRSLSVSLDGNGIGGNLELRLKPFTDLPGVSKTHCLSVAVGEDTRCSDNSNDKVAMIATAFDRETLKGPLSKCVLHNRVAFLLLKHGVRE